MTNHWFEVWVDTGLSPPYVLLVVPSTDSSDACRVVDPQDSGKHVYDAESYEAARHWLLEDEYEQVGGRVRTD